MLFSLFISLRCPACGDRSTYINDAKDTVTCDHCAETYYKLTNKEYMKINIVKSARKRMLIDSRKKVSIK